MPSFIYSFTKYIIYFQIWGVDIIGGNAVNWLECVAKGQRVTLKPLARDKDDLVSVVILHLKKEKVN